MYVLE
jgi:hypothetical protein